ncbi:serine hydrolase domain-containing protein [Paenibacillus sp. NPDC056579]|uniref:serine hydrolase domain-containing protein n=1 Tax=Paenibacillus sp. NPDC056579 TaxID=3345871 RepID=UPI0036BCB59D
MDSVVRLVDRWVEERSIPGAVLHISLGSRYRWQQAFGEADVSSEKKPFTIDTRFDAASLTKVSATLPAILTLEARGFLALNDPVQRFIPEFRHRNVTIAHLLQHASGLPADLPGMERSVYRDVMEEAFRQELLFEPGRQVLYSDLGFILLGAVVERITGEKLAEFVRREIHQPLGMADTGFVPAESERYRIAPTELYRGSYITGEVHDEKSYHLGGVSGSAGLFTTAADLARYGESWLQPDGPVVRREWREICCAQPFMGRGLGWEVWHGQEPAPSCSHVWPQGSFGHTGFTGTSVWIEPQSKLVVVFLTNAVHFGRANPIRRLRPLLHDVIYSSISGVK